MREIKFRAWDKEKNEITTTICIGGLHIPYNSNPNNYILMQYTGLKDKNGKEIYEGDIVRNTADKYHYEIKWDNFESAWSLGENGSPIRRYLLSEYWEVIGNIYENPELLQN